MCLEGFLINWGIVMKTLADKSYEKMWKKIEKDLVEIAADRYSVDMPELSLPAAIIVQAGKDRDSSYFKGSTFFYHAQLLKINPIFIAILVKRAWNLQDSKEIWTEIPIMEDYE